MSPIVAPKRLLVRKTDGWQDVAIVGPMGPPGGEYELGNVFGTADVTVTGTSVGAATPILTLPAINFDGNTMIMLEFWCRAVAPPVGLNNYVAYGLWQDGVFVGTNAPVIFNPIASGTTWSIPTKGEFRITPTAGVHTYSIRAWLPNNSAVFAGGQNPGSCMFLRAKKVMTVLGIDAVEPFIPFTYQNGWSDYGGIYASGGYYRDRGRVYLKGLVKPNAAGPGTVMATLPPGYRPAQFEHLPAALTPTANATDPVRVDTGGQIFLQYNVGWVSLSGTSFRHA